MAKKSTKSVNKSLEIRTYLDSHPGIKPAAAAAALQKRGLDVDAQYISVVKNQAKKRSLAMQEKQAETSQAETSTAVKKATPKASGKLVSGKPAPEVSLNSMLKAKELVKECGGIAEAKLALEGFSQLIG